MIQKNSEFGCWLCGETRLRIEYLGYGAHLASKTRIRALILNPFSIGLPGNPHAAPFTTEQALHSESNEEFPASDVPFRPKPESTTSRLNKDFGACHTQIYSNKKSLPE